MGETRSKPRPKLFRDGRRRPNARNDFHVTASEEFFYQLKGDIVVQTREDGRIVNHKVREGDTFFIPPNVPHSR